MPLVLHEIYGRVPGAPRVKLLNPSVHLTKYRLLVSSSGQIDDLKMTFISYQVARMHGLAGLEHSECFEKTVVGSGLPLQMKKTREEKGEWCTVVREKKTENAT